LLALALRAASARESGLGGWSGVAGGAWDGAGVCGEDCCGVEDDWAKEAAKGQSKAARMQKILRIRPELQVHDVREEEKWHTAFRCGGPLHSRGKVMGDSGVPRE